jgi:hypothetical protein
MKKGVNYSKMRSASVPGLFLILIINFCEILYIKSQH